MYDELLELWRKKKRQKEKMFVFSFINNLILDIYKKFNIDIFRFDLMEFASLYGYKDVNRISKNEILPLVKEINIKKDNNFSKLIAVDLPLSDIYGEDNFSLQKTIDFYNKSLADILVLNIDHNILGLTSKLSKMKIPVIIYSNNNFKMENSDYLELMQARLVESESQGAVMVLVENYPQSFVQNLKGSVQIPVISNVKSSNNKVDGYYAKFSSVFGLIQSDGNKYLNLSELIHDGINDYIGDNK